MAYPVLTYAGAEVFPTPAETESVVPIPHPPTDPVAVKEQGWDKVVLSSFTATDATNLGLLLRQRIIPVARSQGRAAVINITLCNSNQLLFHCTTGSGTLPDNDTWVARKRAAVQRFACSSWYLNCKFDGGNEDKFQRTFRLSDEQMSGYAIHGGGVPVFVAGVEGPVAVVVVSGLAQTEDHGVILDVVRTHWKSQ